MFIAWFKKQTVSLFHRVTGKPKLFSLHLAGGALARETKVSGDKGFSSELVFSWLALWKQRNLEQK